MLKTPISFKGPSDQIQNLFAEKIIYKATQMLLADQLQGWQYNEISQTSRAHVIDDHASVVEVSLQWPLVVPSEENSHINDSEDMRCSCASAKPCIHLAMLTVYNKAKLDQLPPFTQQVKALRDINSTFTAWLNQQWHDPFPNMARHRVIYILDQKEDGALTVSLFKAYLSQENTYQVKTELDSSLYYRKSLPKFVSEVDQYILFYMNQSGLAKVHKFTIDKHRDEDVLMMMLKSRRCFWKACYRPPIGLEEVSELPSGSATPLTNSLQYIQQENMVYYLADTSNHDGLAPKDLTQLTDFVPQLSITSTALNLEWRKELVLQFDVAHPQFNIGNELFDLSDMVKGRVVLNPKQIEQVAASCYQIEKLVSVFAAFEPAINQYFQINDRYMGEDFIAIAPLLVALKVAGWQIDVEPAYRLNHVKAQDWYVNVAPTASQSNKGWFDLSVGIEVNDKKFNLLPFLIRAIKTGAFESVKNELMIQLEEGLNVGIEKKQVAQIIATISELYDGKGVPEQLTLSQHQLLTVAQAQKKWSQALQSDSGGQIQWMGQQEIKAKADAMSAVKRLHLTDVPHNLKADLRPYQHEGFSWLCFLAQHDFHGLLADDMGLGKTLQTLAFIQAEKNTNPNLATSLVVAPTSLLGNWEAEAKKFTPELNVGVMSGPNRTVLYDDFDAYDLIITSYGIIARDFTDLNCKEIHLLVLDEAQAIKNRKTQVAKIIKQLTVQQRLCLSGTPVENHLGELWSIFDFLMPGFLGAENHFKQRFQWPIERSNDERKLNELQLRIAPFVLRRTKSEVAKELPDKSEIIKFIELEESQAAVYESIRLTMTDEIRKAVNNQQHNQILMGNALLRLRQVCCDPQLVPLNSIESTATSAKLNWLKTALPNLVEEGRRVLIFSSFTSMLTVIGQQLKGLGIEYYELTGKTPPAKRTAYINGFQANQKPVFLISLKAGGAGINLTAADTVIHYDPWWNPAAEQQASDRAHRIGQDKQVFVYKLITRGTVEEKIHRLQIHKQQLASGILSQKSDISEILSVHQWEDMLSPIKTH